MHGLVVRTLPKGVASNHSAQDIKSALVETVPKLCPAVSMHAKNQKLVRRTHFQTVIVLIIYCLYFTMNNYLVFSDICC